MRRVAGVYVHVPYCIKKCRYCDFTSFEKKPEDGYFRALAEQIRLAGAKLSEMALNSGVYGTHGYGDLPEDAHFKIPVDTVFFGGGTPSLASFSQLKTVLDAVHESFDIRSAEGLSAPEFTIEVNPETVTGSKAAELKALGFDRVSMGVQSLDDRVLSAMGRVHSADKALSAYGLLRSVGFENINLDLIFGAPMRLEGGLVTGQSLTSWEQTLRRVIELRPEHISFYSLQLEEGTPLYNDYSSGRADLPSWEENRRMYRLALKLLKEAGYVHYEVSNAALRGFKCRHNLKYWTMQPYFGFGTSAHSFTGLCRGEADWSRGAEASEDGKYSIFGLEPEGIADLKGDFVFTQLRLIAGMDPQLYKDIFGSDLFEDFREPLQELLREGLLCILGGRIAFTEKGLDNTNPVMQRLITAL